MLVLVSMAGGAHAQLAPCNNRLDPRIAAAWQKIEASVDPCGEDHEIRAVLDTIRGCLASRYRVCTDSDTERNTFDPPAREARVRVGTITWNPTLETELETTGCGEDPARPVLRDPTASLLHELVHAAQDCRNLEASQLELDAVRVENIYRRAAGLCQRTRYGEELLPSDTARQCEPGHCTCARRGDPLQITGYEAEASDPGVGRKVGTRLGDVEARP